MTSFSVDEFSLISQIGEGTFSKVFLVRYKKDGKLYALKVMQKKFIIERRKQESIMTEKAILSDVKHSNLVKMHFSFQDHRNLYFVLQYCSGGEMFHLLAMLDKFSEDQTKFYVAQIILALEELHKKNIIYRDLKPENIIIDQEGYLKMTDFGLSKMLNPEEEMTLSFCGTPEYLAPEIIKRVGHGFGVDWWSLGCFTYEMITGRPPFQNKNRSDLYESILKKELDLTKFSDKLQDFLKMLLQKDFKQRLGYRGVHEIKNHEWLSEINWKAIEMRKIKAPFIPNLSSQTDTTNFDKRFMKPYQQNYLKYEEYSSDQEDHFEGFSFNLQQE